MRKPVQKSKRRFATAWLSPLRCARLPQLDVHATMQVHPSDCLHAAWAHCAVTRVSFGVWWGLREPPGRTCCCCCFYSCLPSPWPAYGKCAAALRLPRVSMTAALARFSLQGYQASEGAAAAGALW